MSDHSRDEYNKEESKQKFILEELGILELRRFEQPRYLCGKFVMHNAVQNFVFFCIIANTIFMGIGTTDLAYDNPKVQNVLDICDRTFLIIFTIESALQLFFRSWRLFKSGWLTFDITVVILSWAMENLQVIRGFRILRAARLMMHVAPIRDLIEAVGSVMSNLSGLLLLSSLIIYIFAVLFTQLFKDLELEEDYFTRLDYTLFSLLQFMTLDFADPMRETMEHYPMAWIPFVIFILVMGFVVYNLIAAMVCDAVAVLGEREKKKQELKLKSKEETAQIHTDQEKLALLSHQVQVLLKSQLLNHGLLQELFEKLCGSPDAPQMLQSIEDNGRASLADIRNPIIESFAETPSPLHQSESSLRY